MIRELQITDDRGVDHPVRTDDLLAGEPWNAARSTLCPVTTAPAIYRTWTQRLALGLNSIIASVILTGIVRNVLNIHYFMALILVVLTGIALYMVYRRYGGKLHSIFWRRRLAQRSAASATRQHARLSIARDHKCPCCAYGLSDVPVDADGCTPCPECGAAWCMDHWCNDAGIYRPPAVTADGQGHDQSRTNASDARGVVVPLLAGQKEIDRQEAVRVCQGRPTRVRLRLSLLAWAIQLLLTGGIAWFVVMLAEPQHSLAWVGAVTMIILGSMLVSILVGIAYTHQLALATHPYLIRAMVVRNQCPCCESQLRATPSPIDGCLLCDTCGSAWNPPATDAPGNEPGASATGF